MLLVGGDHDGKTVALRDAPDFIDMPKMKSVVDLPPPDAPVPDTVNRSEIMTRYTRRSVRTASNTYWFMAPEDWTDDMAFSHLFDR